MIEVGWPAAGPAFVMLGLVAGALLLGRLRELDASDNATNVQASIVVPARNEATTLPILLRSLQRLDPAPHEVIVVDDESDDATAEIAARSGARVIQTSGPPPGWLGKPWACQVGAEAATGTYVVFLDADTQLAPNALARLCAQHESGLRSVAPYHRTERAYEQLSAFPNLVAMMGSGAFAVWAPSKQPVAFGPCVVARRSEYLRLGGHGTARASVVEDIELARAYAAAALAVQCRAGRSVVAYRMYPQGVRQLIEGWTKNLALGARSGAPFAVALTVWWVAAYAAIAAGAVGGWIRWATGNDASAWIALAWGIAVAEVAWMLRRIGRFRWWTAAAFPVPLAAFVALFAWSFARDAFRRAPTWRGRTLDVRTPRGR